MGWVSLLQQGADGVVFIEHSGDAILAVVTAFMRRWGQKSATRRFLARFGLLIDLERYRVELGGAVLDLTLTELKVLKELASDDDRVIPRMAIQQQVFGQLAPGNRSLDVHVCSLRKNFVRTDSMSNRCAEWDTGCFPSAEGSSGPRPPKTVKSFKAARIVLPDNSC